MHYEFKLVKLGPALMTRCGSLQLHNDCRSGVLRVVASD